MRTLIAFFIRRFVMAIAIFGAIALFGVVSLLNRGIAFFPDISLPVVTVTTVYPGASPEEMTRDVSERIEDELVTIPNIQAVSSYNFDSLSLVVAEFDLSVNENEAAINVDQKVSRILNQLPAEAEAPSIDKFDPADAPILSFAVIAPGEDRLAVQDYVDDRLKPALLQVDNVAQVTIVGQTEREVAVYVQPDLLERYNLSALSVASALQRAASRLPAGDVTMNGRRSLIASDNGFASANDVSDALIDSQRGLRVSDVAVVRESHEDITSYTRFNGESAVLVEVRQASGTNSVAVANDVRATLADVHLPQGYRLETVLDAASFTSSSVANTGRSVLQAVIAVSLVTLIFLGRLGSTFSVALAIPLTMAGALIFMQLWGLDLNLMTLIAITVAVGLVVDDSTVIAENTEKRLNQGLQPREAALEGSSEVATAVLASTLALLAVFIPISLLPGIVGQFFANFGLVMSATIVTSYLEAMFFLPVRLAYLPNPLPPSWQDVAKAPGRLLADVRWGLRLYVRPVVLLVLLALGAVAWARVGVIALAIITVPFVLMVVRYVLRLLFMFLGAITRSLYMVVNGGMMRLSQAYGRAVSVAIDHSLLVLIVAFALLATAGIAGQNVRFSFVAKYDSEVLDVALELPAGTSLETTAGLSAQLEGALLARPEVTDVMTIVGAGDFVGQASPESAAFTVLMTPKNARERNVYQLVPVLESYLRNTLVDVPEADLQVSVGDATGGSGSDVVADVFRQSIYANDLAAVRNVEPEVFAFLVDNPYLRNVTSDLGNAVNERAFVVDRASLVGTGLAVADFSTLLRLYNVGVTVGSIDGSSSVAVTPYQDADVVLTIDPALLADEQALLSLPVMVSALGTSLPLSTFGHFESRLALSQINRVNQQFNVNFEADLTPDAPSTLVLQADVRQAVTDAGVTGDTRMADPPGLNPVEELAFYAPIAMAVALMLNYLVIASQFNSFRFPIYLLMTVPLGLIGALWMLALTNTEMTVFGVLGVVMLVGLVSKNAILLLEVVLTTMEQKRFTLKDALVDAATSRLRPIVMTTLTVIIIGIPMVTSRGEGAEILFALGWVIIGGVTVAATLTLFVVPAAFYRFERGRYGETPSATTKKRAWWGRVAKSS
jgi:HAE1 family hydrophobic/amphiphilic exporter-1